MLKFRTPGFKSRHGIRNVWGRFFDKELWVNCFRSRWNIFSHQTYEYILFIKHLALFFRSVCPRWLQRATICVLAANKLRVKFQYFNPTKSTAFGCVAAALPHRYPKLSALSLTNCQHVVSSTQHSRQQTPNELRQDTSMWTHPWCPTEADREESCRSVYAYYDAYAYQ